jgi:hypothetical protein
MPTMAGRSNVERTKPTRWIRWKRLAHRAAVIQSNILLGALYILVFLPIAFVRRPFGRSFRVAGGWMARKEEPPTLTGARRQF